MNNPYMDYLTHQLNPAQLFSALNNYASQQQQINSIPQGLQSLYLACHRIYPENTNPLQITSVRKFWLGGPEPLDYITLYNNAGDPRKNIPPHWHYISFGLSDLYGDNRVHNRISNQSDLSGYGFELTFRLKKHPSETQAPLWPANILQSLAKYVFHTNNIICSGDHVSENRPLDNQSDSKIQHMLMTDDPQLGTISTPYGKVTFIQIVGVTNDELKASQQWNVNGMIELMKKMPEIGGDFLVTDMRRQHSIFELNKNIKQAVEKGINNEGSNLSGVSAKCSFQPRIVSDQLSSDEDNTSSIDSDKNEFEEEDEENFDEERTTSESESEENCNSENIKLIDSNATENESKQLDNDMNKLESELSKITIAKEDKDDKQADDTVDQNGQAVQIEQQMAKSNCDKSSSATNRQAIVSPRNILSPKSECSSSMSVSHENQNNCNSSMSYTSETGNDPVDLLNIKYIKEVHIFLNLEASLLLPLMLKGRLKHNHHFTYKSTKLAITFLTPSVSGAYVSTKNPFGYCGPWLQILLENDLVERMIADLEGSEDRLHPDCLPKTFCWDNLAIKIQPE